MSHRALGQQFFHGSPQEFKPGDRLLPTATTGMPPMKGDSNPNKVYVTPHPFVAANYTWAFDEHGKLAGDQRETNTPHGHIYEVEPVGRRLRDKNGPKHIPDASYEVREAIVKRKLDPKEWR